MLETGHGPARPTHLKLVTGNPGKRALNENEPRPQPAPPSPPPHLDDGAQVEWGQVSEQLYSLGCLDGFGHQARLAAEAYTALTRLADPIHRSFASNVVLELCNQR